MRILVVSVDLPRSANWSFAFVIQSQNCPLQTRVMRLPIALGVSSPQKLWARTVTALFFVILVGLTFY